MTNVGDQAGDTDAAEVLAGGGEMGALMRAHDWAATPLGPVAGWPRALKTCVRLMLTSRQPMWLGWGERLTFLYNDPYRSIVGGKHPHALGQPTNVVWREIWADIAPRIRSTLGGDEGTYDEALLLLMERHGYREETYYTFSYSPIPDDEGHVAGLFCANTDDTRRVIGERQLALLRDLATGTAEARTVADACALSMRGLETNPRDIPFALLYLLAPDRRRAALGGTAHIARGHPAAPEVIALDEAAAWPLAAVAGAKAPRLISDLGASFTTLPTGAWDRPPTQAVALPLTLAGQSGLAGALIVGLNPYRLLDDDYQRFLDLVAGQVGTAIADARAYEEERRRAEALAELDRAKTAFFHNVSHEFRTPLTLSLGPVEDILADPAEVLSSEGRERLEIAHRNQLRLLRLVNTLLDFSRIEAGRTRARYEPTDLAALTADLASAFRSAVERAGLRLVVDCPPLPEPVYVDREMWEKIVLNLLSNALKFTFQGEIAVALRPAGAHVELEVRDTGTGIPPEELPHLFERFHRVQGARARTHEGTGIGLALVRELARLHGGEARVESTIDVGTAFTVTLPLGTAHLPSEHISSPRTPDTPEVQAAPYVEEALRWLPGADGTDGANGEDHPIGLRDIETSAPTSDTGAGNEDRARILLADDNADMRDYLCRLLDRRYAVRAVADGATALAAARDWRPELVLSDVMMPGLDGMALLKALRADPRTRTVPVILLSARAGEEAAIGGLDAGADDYLVKPFAARELLARVRTHVELARLRARAEDELRQRTRQAELAAQIGAALTGGATLPRQLQGCAEALVRHLDAAFARVWTLDEAAGMLVLRASAGLYTHLDGAHSRIPLGALRVGCVAAERRPHLTNSVVGDPLIDDQEWARREGMVAFAGYPLVIGERLIGVMGLFARHTLTDATLSALGTVANEIALGIARTQADEERAELLTRAQAARTEAEAERDRLQQVLDALPAGVVIADASGRFAMANEAVVPIFGAGIPGRAVPREQFEAHEVYGVYRLDGTPYPSHELPLQRALWRGEVARGEQFLTRVPATGREILVLANSAPLRDAEGAIVGAVAVFQDITALRELERAREEFLSSAAHDLKTPLTGIRGQAQLAQRRLARLDTPQTAPVLGQLVRIQESADAMLGLIDELVDVTRQQMGGGLDLHREQADLVALVQGCVESHRDASGRALRVEADVPALHADVDAARIARVVDNLLSNALKYSPAESPIAIHIGQEEGPAGPEALIAVRDEGIGIPAADLPHIFDRFQRASNVAGHIQGTGIGLASARQIVEQHGGTISAESTEGAGSTFTVHLPLVEDEGRHLSV